MAFSEASIEPARPSAPEDFYQLGLRYSTGQAGAVDLIKAHMWFNLAAVRGIAAAKRWRKDLAEQMTQAQVAAAQRAAREWLAATA